MDTPLQGLSLIGSQRGSAGERSFRATNPASGDWLTPTYYAANSREVDAAVALAVSAFNVFRHSSGTQRALLLNAIADRLQGLEAELVAIVPGETGLPPARVQGELGRTVNQLRAFARLASEGSWVDARIDHGDPNRAPLPKPDVRSQLEAIGPVVVFGASNFPLAFSTPGGDTAAALAAGCPVIVKAHPLHPSTSELVGLAIQDAVAACGLPPGVFSMLFDDGIEVGRQLVLHPDVAAVGFTGSIAGGRALMDLAASRPHPIPVFAEMGSNNPVFVLRGALEARGDAIAQQLAASITQGTGQFCTCPGLIIVERTAAGEQFLAKLGELLRAAAAATMLSPGMAERFIASFCRVAGAGEVQALLSPTVAAATVTPGLLQCQVPTLIDNPALREEMFGPAALALPADTKQDLAAAVSALDGQLTATVFAEPADYDTCRFLLPLLTAKAGRVLMNGVPTGVEVCDAMVHGGPYPACSDPRFTAVGTGSIRRFSRPVCYQNIPDLLLPLALQEANPLGIVRRVDGKVLPAA